MSILKSAFKVSFLTMISRISGYVRDMFLSSVLGVGITSDIFLIVLRLPNLFRTLFGEGALSIAFIPLYSSVLESRGKSSAQHIAAVTQSILSLALLLFCAFLYFSMPQLIEVTTPGFRNYPDAMLEITRLSRITISYLAFISLVTFYGGILNSHGKYSPFALVQVIMNIGLIIALLLDGRINMPILDILAYAVLVCGAVELLWMWCVAKIYGVAPGFAKIEITPEIKKFFSRILPGIVGSGVWQINSWIEIMIVSSVPGAMSLIYYADRINQLPLALIGTALGTTLMPALARRYAAGDIASVQRQKTSAIEVSMLMSIPSMVIISMLSYPIISFLFQNGKFTQEAAYKSAAALSIYAIALPAQIISKIFLSSFYASGDTRTPVKIASCCIAINAIVALSLIDKLQHLGMAWSAVCSAWSNILISYIILKRRLVFHISRELFYKVVKIAISGCIMAVAIGFYDVGLSIYDIAFCIVYAMLIYIIFCFVTSAVNKDELYSYFK